MTIKWCWSQEKDVAEKRSELKESSGTEWQQMKPEIEKLIKGLMNSIESARSTEWKPVTMTDRFGFHH